MIETIEQTTCKACGQPIVQKGGKGHRQRNYCDDKCKHVFFRRTRHTVPIDVPIEKDSQQQRITELEQEIRNLKMLASKRTRGKDRAGLQQRLMARGLATGYQSVSVRITIGQGVDDWRLFAKDASEDMLARAIVAAGGV